jgi:hypothetical protein
MEEKLIIISIDDEIVDTADNFNSVDLCHYLIRNSIQMLEFLVFDAFVYVICDWR